MATNSYDVLIVGAGIAGCAMAHALATRKNSTKKLRIGLLERSLAEPDRIVGELLQPGGVQALKTLGMDWCLEGIDAVPIGGYCVVNAAADEQVHIPYPNSHEGRGFHHGKFIMRLREAAMRAPGVETIEATVSELITKADAVVGVAARRTTPSGEPGPIESFHAALTIVADGCFSNFRNFVLGSQSCKPEVKSHFMGFVLKDAKLPIPNHGTVVLVKDSGPVLLYQIGDDSKETRVLVDLKIPVPADPKDFIISHIIPQLPKSLHSAFHAALDGNRLRRMPNSFLPSVQQGRPAVDSKKGVFLLGDSWNMRHPLTGGGMTVAFTDVVILQSLLASTDFTNWDEISAVLRRWHWERKGLSSTINILSVALYNLFGAEDENLAVLRRGCFEYFNRGGDCVTGPVTLLSGLSDSPLLLARHFFSVALYAIYIMFADSSILLYPYLVLKSFLVFYTAIIVFMPLVWSEVRWWSPDDSVSVRKYTLRSLSAILMASGILFYCGMFPTIPLLL